MVCFIYLEIDVLVIYDQTSQHGYVDAGITLTSDVELITAVFWVVMEEIFNSIVVLNGNL